MSPMLKIPFKFRWLYEPVKQSKLDEIKSYNLADAFCDALLEEQERIADNLWLLNVFGACDARLGEE